MLEYDGARGQIQRWYAYGLGANDALSRLDVPGNTRETLVAGIPGSLVGVLYPAGTMARTGYLPYGLTAVAPASRM